MSLPLLIAAAIPVAILALVIRTWWNRRFLLKNVPSPVSVARICIWRMRAVALTQPTHNLGQLLVDLGP
jgi:hypothetical protein